MNHPGTSEGGTSEGDGSDHADNPVGAGDAGVEDDTPARRPPEVLEQWQAPDGRRLLIRPLFSDDAARELRFLEGLSPDTRYERLFSHRNSLRPGELRQLVRFDVRQEVALLAAVESGDDEEIVGVARLHNSGEGSAEFALVVGDAWQRRGVGSRLLERLLDVARSGGVVQVTGTTRSSNEPMKQLARKLGFELTPDPGDGSLTRLARAL